MRIKILADDVASQIAAGEVVERPASVVKELLENAIDAGASRIRIRVEDAGRKLIEVSDDGMGIPAAELSLAVSRHATSKLATSSDLFNIRTLGFRGEALASVGSVSRLTLDSRESNHLSGGKILVEGGRTLTSEQSGGPEGTVVRVENLFFNTPARLKFLKKDVTEKQQIDGLVTRYALAYPAISIHLEEDGKPVLQTTGNGDRREILAQLYDVDMARRMLEVVFEEETIKITGFISPISMNRSNRRDITFFVNGRWVQDVSLTTALLKAYQTYLMVGRYPIAALFLDLDPAEVDVNVHPAKAEVRFRQPDLIFTAVQRAVRRALLAYSPVPQLSYPTWQSDFSTASEQKDTQPIIGVWGQQGVTTPPQHEPPAGFQSTSRTGIPGIPILRLVGQIGGTYLVAEGPDGLYLIDQHAAHERILFEKLTGLEGKIPTQLLLEPVIIQVQPAQVNLLSDNLEALQSIGFMVEDFGQNSYRIRSIPELFQQNDPRVAIRCVIEDFEEDETPLQGMVREKLIARICKRMAVKGGTVLAEGEQKALLTDLENCVSPRTCPHGRPTMIHLPVDLLERQFGRRGARSI